MLTLYTSQGLVHALPMWVFMLSQWSAEIFFHLRLVPELSTSTFTIQLMYYNVTSSRVRVTNVAVEKRWVLHILSVCWSLSYLALKAHAPYCHLWPASLYSIFLHHLINGKIFGGYGEVTEYRMCVLIFSTTFVWSISHSKKNWARCDRKCILVFM